MKGLRSNCAYLQWCSCVTASVQAVLLEPGVPAIPTCARGASTTSTRLGPPWPVCRARSAPNVPAECPGPRGASGSCSVRTKPRRSRVRKVRGLSCCFRSSLAVLVSVSCACWPGVVFRCFRSFPWLRTLGSCVHRLLARCVCVCVQQAKSFCSLAGVTGFCFGEEQKCTAGRDETSVLCGKCKTDDVYRSEFGGVCVGM